ncbi:MAG: hypothetical protein U9R75_12450 [Candidatus Thermoplasmatota archaeon]|nr:hypothetical protein [Candidatus Thermoplasmatota archaeon]
MVEYGYLMGKSPADIIAFVAQRTLAEISTMSADALEHIGWFYRPDPNGPYYVNPVVNILYSLTSAGIWIARTDASGKVEEANSHNIRGDTQYMNGRMVKLSNIARLIDLGVNDTGTLPLKIALIDETLAAGGTLGATPLVAAITDKQIYPERVHLELIPATTNISGLGGDSAIITLQDDAGTPVVSGRGVLSHTQQICDMKMLIPTTHTKDLDMVVEAGISGNVGASRIIGYILYQGVTPP